MKFLDNIFSKINSKNISGLSDELKIRYIQYLYLNNKQDIIVLTSSLYEATKVYNALKTHNKKALFFPMDDFLTSVSFAISPELEVKRIETLNNISNTSKNIIVTNLTGFLKFVSDKKTFDSFKIKLEINKDININTFENHVKELGYNETSIVTSTGEYARRKYIIDIFPYNHKFPIRIELFGNTIESIREFDIESQLSISNKNQIEITTYKEIVNSDNKSSLFDILNNPLIIKFNPEIIKQENILLEQQISEYKQSKNINNKIKFMFNYNDFLLTDEINLANFNIDNSYLSVNSKEIENFRGNYKLLIKFLNINRFKYNVVLYIDNQKIIDFIKSQFDIKVTNDNSIVKNKINFFNEKINKGFILNNYMILGLNDIEYYETTTKYSNPIKIGSKIKNFNEIKKGDYIVHRTHGIGIYKGVNKITKDSVEKDYILIQYAGTDKVYVPVEKINTIYKYTDADGHRPKINKLNSTSWERTKNYVKQKIKDISSELLKLYAEREAIKKNKYQTFPEEIIFANEFEFTLTKDQNKCIKEILEDLKKDKLMDRLLCGDVGFGKTEVAFRAIFNVVLNGYQVAYLCPTTILSKQQYENAIKRFSKFPINIELVNRYTSSKKISEIIKRLKSGKIDVIFGTHKLFNKNIEYSKLGLLIIDEEQRFGVSQKEKLKSVSKSVNVLTLSATPIPRTLKMAMSGLRDLSVLDTPPEDRYPVQTYVIEKNDMLIKDAIYKELSRKGQIFYVYNNVEKIENEARRLKQLIPEAKICYAHGRMHKNIIENIMQDYINFKYDILVCTTIIETGIDIPNVNTLIVINSQNFGLSQLYQLRGRVGRTNRIAYAYLTYDPLIVLTETAIKRLKAIKEFTELGSGYKIALRDLSIRGAGDLLGGEQAGFIDSVGIDLYTEMVKETIAELKGGKLLKNNEDDESALLNVSTHISENYVGDESVRIEIHKLINEIDSNKSFKLISNEIKDRFGKINPELEIYMYQKWFENQAKKLSIKKVIQSKDKIEIEIPEQISNTINGEKLFLKIYKINTKFKLKYNNKRIYISLPITNLEQHYIYYLILLLENINECIE